MAIDQQNRHIRPSAMPVRGDSRMATSSDFLRPLKAKRGQARDQPAPRGRHAIRISWIG